jgi:hypothetical protein
MNFSDGNDDDDIGFAGKQQEDSDVDCNETNDLDDMNNIVDTIMDGMDDDSDGKETSPSRAHDGNKKSTAQLHYEQSGKTLKILMAMGVGLINKDTGASIVDEAMSMLKDLKINASEYKLSCEILRSEVTRRGESQKLHPGEKTPKPAQYPGKKCTSWLEDHPLSRDDDVEFVTSVLKQSLTEKVDQMKNDPNEKLVNKGSPWQGNIPYLRLFYVLIENDIIPLYRKRYAKNDQPRIDAGKDKLNLNEFLDAAAKRWNDPTFNPITNCRPSLHKDFRSVISLSFLHVAKMMPADRKKINDVLAGIRGKLVEVLRKYNLSGAGCDKGKEDFLGESYPTYILYFWELMEEHDMLTTSMQLIDSESAAADAEDTIDVVAMSNRKKSVSPDNTGLEKAIVSVGNSNSESIKEFTHVIKESSEKEAKVQKDIAEMESRDKRFIDNRKYLITLEERMEKYRIESREIEHELDDPLVPIQKKRRLEEHYEENRELREGLKKEITALKNELNSNK